MAKGKKSSSNTKQQAPVKEIKVKKTSSLSPAREDMNNTFFNEMYKAKSEAPGLKTKDLRNKLILIYNINKARANDIAVRVIKQYYLKHPDLKAT